MKRTGHLFPQLLDRENLRLAFWKAQRGKRGKADARAFAARLETNLQSLRAELATGTLSLGDYQQFTIHDPKERLITAPAFRERVLHHALINVCEPVFERWLVADTFACRTGRGRLAALARTQSLASRWPFFLKLDIRKYFDSISHAVLRERLARLFKDARLLELCGQIIASHASDALVPEHEPRGLPIGALTSQHFANFYLGWFDRFVKERLRVPAYVRYMDDCVLWGDSARQLQDWLAAVREFLATQLRLELKPPYINRTAHGMDFLGCRVFQHYLILNRRSRTRFRRKLRWLETAWLDGQIDELELQQRAAAVVAFARTPGLRSWRFRHRALQGLPVSGQGLEPREPWRQLEQHAAELPVGEPEQQLAGQPEQQSRLPCGRSSVGLADAEPD